MTCNEAVRMIPDFLNDDLDIDTLEEFLTHLGSCSECMEELTIMALVTDGLSRLEEGSSFNVGDVLRARIDKAKHKIKAKRHLEMATGILAVSAVAASAAGIILYISMIGI